MRTQYHKIGYSEKDPNKRAKQLSGNSAVPLPFVVKKSWYTNHVKFFEQIMHLLFTKARVNKKREFFEAPLEMIIRVGDAVDVLIKNAVRQ